LRLANVDYLILLWEHAKEEEEEVAVVVVAVMKPEENHSYSLIDFAAYWLISIGAWMTIYYDVWSYLSSPTLSLSWALLPLLLIYSHRSSLLQLHHYSQICTQKAH
jgi:hypothetical protein